MTSRLLAALSLLAAGFFATACARTEIEFTPAMVRMENRLTALYQRFGEAFAARDRAALAGLYGADFRDAATGRGRDAQVEALLVEAEQLRPPVGFEHKVGRLVMRDGNERVITEVVEVRSFRRLGVDGRERHVTIESARTDEWVKAGEAWVLVASRPRAAAEMLFLVDGQRVGAAEYGTLFGR